MEYKWFVEICLQCPLYSLPYLCSSPSIFSYKSTYDLISVIFKYTICCFQSVISISTQKLRMSKTEEDRAQQWTCPYGQVDRQFINPPIVDKYHTSLTNWKLEQHLDTNTWVLEYLKSKTRILNTKRTESCGYSHLLLMGLSSRATVLNLCLVSCEPENCFAHNDSKLLSYFSKSYENLYLYKNLHSLHYCTNIEWF